MKQISNAIFTQINDYRKNVDDLLNDKEKIEKEMGSDQLNIFYTEENIKKRALLKKDSEILNTIKIFWNLARNGDAGNLEKRKYMNMNMKVHKDSHTDT